MHLLQIARHRLVTGVLRRQFGSASQVGDTNDGFARMNIYKNGAQAPKEMKDEEYPDWLWRLHDAQATKEELLREARKLFDEGGYDRVFECMHESRMKRLFKLNNRERIKMNNARRKGGQVV
ncbi:hypothetical protein BWQ96_02419 [Gracilariopsis chorda]|uniref:Large ribosomal subunit protein mL54 n=1 Tax=Gracilariopsis chorda TaxID=448386 RepID=A0A2V3J1B0_9FLOR|nr:hypothetical protein BWQ96_02419 [Gracilariopsis chorda]|eukprot:PXF47737.1 hypothetical protein BWQ96_02419 [Gracilariopsis chorda]